MKDGRLLKCYTSTIRSILRYAPWPMSPGFQFLSSLRKSISRFTTSWMEPDNRPTSELILPQIYTPQLVKSWLPKLVGVRFEEDKFTVLVLSATQLKFKHGQEHEKTLFKLEVQPIDNRPSFITYLITERGAEIEDPSDSFPSIPSPSDACLSCAVKSTLLSPNPPAALDRVILAHGGRSFNSYLAQQEKTHLVLCTITMRDPMTLPQLAVLLDSIHSISSRYDVLKYNCYWYTHVLGESIIQLFGGETLVTKDARKKGLWGSISLGSEKGKTASVAEVVDHYSTAWPEIEATIVKMEGEKKV